jgi:hypothetical protein
MDASANLDSQSGNETAAGTQQLVDLSRGDSGIPQENTGIDTETYLQADGIEIPGLSDSEACEAFRRDVKITAEKWAEDILCKWLSLNDRRPVEFLKYHASIDGTTLKIDVIPNTTTPGGHVTYHDNWDSPKKLSLKSKNSARQTPLPEGVILHQLQEWRESNGEQYTIEKALADDRKRFLKELGTERTTYTQTNDMACMEFHSAATHFAGSWAEDILEAWLSVNDIGPDECIDIFGLDEGVKLTMMAVPGKSDCNPGDTIDGDRRNVAKRFALLKSETSARPTPLAVRNHPAPEGVIRSGGGWWKWRDHWCLSSNGWVNGGNHAPFLPYDWRKKNEESEVEASEGGTPQVDKVLDETAVAKVVEEEISKGEATGDEHTESEAAQK